MSKVAQTFPKGLLPPREGSAINRPVSDVAAETTKRQRSIQHIESPPRGATASAMPIRHSASDDEITPITSKGAPLDYQSTQEDRDAPQDSSSQGQSMRPREQARSGGEGSNKSRSRSLPSRADEEQDEELPWYKRVAEKYGSVELENKGSVARDHLALERTFLAWLRTSLAFASIGIAITQLFRLNTTIAKSAEYDNVSSLVPKDSMSSLDAGAAQRLRHVALDYEREIPCKQGERGFGRICFCGADYSKPGRRDRHCSNIFSNLNDLPAFAFDFMYNPPFSANNMSVTEYLQRKQSAKKDGGNLQRHNIKFHASRWTFVAGPTQSALLVVSLF